MRETNQGSSILIITIVLQSKTCDEQSLLKYLPFVFIKCILSRGSTDFRLLGCGRCGLCGLCFFRILRGDIHGVTGNWCLCGR